MAGFFEFNPFTTTLDAQRYNDMLGSNPVAAAYALMQRSGYRPEPGYRSFLAGLAPLLETLRPLYVANEGLPAAQGTDAINAFGQLFQELLRPKATQGSDDLIGRGYEALINLGKGGFTEGTPQDAFLGNTDNLTRTLAALMGQRLGGRVMSQFLNEDSIAQLQAQFANRQAGGYDKNWIAFLQEMGYMPGNYMDAKPTVDDPWKPTPEETPIIPQDEMTPDKMPAKPKLPTQTAPRKFRPDILPPTDRPNRPRAVGAR